MDFKKMFEKVGYFIGSLTLENWVGIILGVAVIFFLSLFFFINHLY